MMQGACGPAEVSSRLHGLCERNRPWQEVVGFYSAIDSRYIAHRSHTNMIQKSYVADRQHSDMEVTYGYRGLSPEYYRLRLVAHNSAEGWSHRNPAHSFIHTATCILSSRWLDTPRHDRCVAISHIGVNSLFPTAVQGAVVLITVAGIENSSSSADRKY